jgi:glycosyltransferase involved in cell wall biosynthesis
LKIIKILKIITTLNPKSGGPQATIIQNSNNLCNNGFSVDILTSDKKNFIKRADHKFKIIKLNTDSKPYNFSFKIIKWIINNKKNYDFFIIHGLWEFNSLLARIFIKKNYFVVTHGQLDPYFNTLTFKKIKKQIYWYLIEHQNLINSKGILVSGKSEIKMIKNSFVNTDNIKLLDVGYSNYLIPKMIQKKHYNKTFYKNFPILKNKKFILFIGRINHKKGLDILVDAILKVNDLKNFYFLFAGFDNFKDDYVRNILKTINANIILQQRVVISKFLEKDLKIAALSLCSATILPSRGENFGVSVVESLMFSKPPLITNKVGIFHEIIKYKAGLICKSNRLSITTMIQKFINLKKNELSKYQKNSFKCYQNIFNINEKNNNNLKILNYAHKNKK